MNWYKKSKKTYTGYKIVGLNIGTNTPYSIYNKKPIETVIGKKYLYNNNGLFLGTSKQFCMDYYACGTPDEDKELLLHFMYEDKDILKGEPMYPNGEVQVSEATLIGIEEINKEKEC